MQSMAKLVDNADPAIDVKITGALSVGATVYLETQRAGIVADNNFKLRDADDNTWVIRVTHTPGPGERAEAVVIAKL